ncbi:hypothetical protein ACJX0J_012512, partial [Zea mays]
FSQVSLALLISPSIVAMFIFSEFTPLGVLGSVALWICEVTGAKLCLGQETKGDLLSLILLTNAHLYVSFHISNKFNKIIQILWTIGVGTHFLTRILFYFLIYIYMTKILGVQLNTHCMLVTELTRIPSTEL